MFDLVCVATTVNERQGIRPVEKFCHRIGQLNKTKSSNVTLIPHLAFSLFLLLFALSFVSIVYVFGMNVGSVLNSHVSSWGKLARVILPSPRSFFHKFLAALEVQFHTRLLLMMKYNECRSFGVSVFRHFEALVLWLWHYWFYLHVFCLIAFLLFSSLYILFCTCCEYSSILDDYRLWLGVVWIHRQIVWALASWYMCQLQY